MALFNDQIEPPTTPDDLQVEEKDYETELVGEGKKFKTTKELAKAKAQSDAFIEQLKNENKVAREAAERLQNELKTAKTLKEFLDQMKPQSANLQPPAKEPTNEGEGALNEDTIKQIVEQTIAARRTEQQDQINLENVKNELIKTYGASYENVLRKRTQELGMTSQEMTEMAMKKPRAFLTLVSPNSGLPHTDLFGAPHSGVNTEALKSSGSNTKNWSYYEKIRKTDSREYFKPSMHNEMMKQLELLGPDEFYK